MGKRVKEATLLTMKAPRINFEGVFNDLKCLAVLFKVRCTAGGVLHESLGTPSFGRQSEIAVADDDVAVNEDEAASSG